MNKMTTKPRIGTAAVTAIYCRISKDRKAEREGVDRQAEDCLAICKRKGWALAAEPFIDNDVSASKYTRRRRPQYRALMEGITEGRVNRIVVWKLDRLYRQPRELEDLIDHAEKGRVTIVTVMGGDIDLNTSAGRGMARVGVAMNAVSSDDTSERILRQQKERRAHGLSTGGPRPFGWSRDHMHHDPKESALLHKAMDDLLAGRSLGDVAREWTKAKVRNRAWGSNDVVRAVTMQRHAGRVVHHGEDVGPATWKPLVERARFEQVLSVVRARQTGVGVPRRRSLLTGLMTCGICGAKMTRSVANKGVTVWRCHKGPDGIGCGGVSIRADIIEPLLTEAAFAYVDRVELADLVSEGSPDLSAVTKALEALDRREAQLARSFASGKTTRRLMEMTGTQIENDRADLGKRLARDQRTNTLSSFAGKAGALRVAWPELTVDQRRTIIGEALQTITIMPTGGTAGWRFDPERVVIGTPKKKPAR